MYSSRDPKLFSNPLLYLKRYTTLRFDQDAQKGLRNTAEFYQKGRGYAIEHCTKPQTLGYNLADSPVGLLAWIYEKLVGWTDKYPWTDDEGTSSVLVRVHVVLTFTCSTRVDLGLLVLEAGPYRVHQDLLRDDRRRHARRVRGRETDDRSLWHVILPGRHLLSSQIVRAHDHARRCHG